MCIRDRVKMSEGVEVEFIKLLTSVETKNDEDVIKAFKAQLSSGVLTLSLIHILSNGLRTQKQINLTQW